MAYNSTVDTIYGDKLMLFITDGSSTLPIAFGTSCSLEISADTIDTSNKMSGNWKEFLTGQLGFTISSESMMSLTTGHLSLTKLMALMESRTPISFAFSKTAGSPEFGENGQLYSGKAIITSLSMTAEKGNIATCSCSMQGTGPITKGALAGGGGGGDNNE
jgi:predicted secreted protein